MLEIVRYTQPTAQQFEEAAALCHLHWDYLRALDGPGRVRGFQALGVELAVAMEDGRMQAVAFLLPAPAELTNGIPSHFLFQVCARPGTMGAGGLLITRVMSWYPVLLGIGVTAPAEKLYGKLRWKSLPGVWRGVHPIDLTAMLADYGERVTQPWLGSLLRAISGIYGVFSAVADGVLALGRRAGDVPPQAGNNRESAVASYIGLLASGPLRAADVGGIGRITSAPPGLGSIVHHAALWRGLRRRHAKFCEILLLSPEAKRKALLRGYIPLRMPFWYWDAKNVLGEAEIARLRETPLSFLHTDKVV